ncbi:hypothetical protein FOA52_008266 [Chlamydomonas sp. UWO 241]|nr:hypothetical protein FOA52_008266 [Chlamydomonas sp. UWO 241]
MACAEGSQPLVVVVGGGLSGLIAAVLLEEEGQPVWLVEARDTLGGRLHAGEPVGAGSPHLLDLGAAWIWPRSNPRLAHWLALLALPLFEQHSAGAGLRELPNQQVRRLPTSGGSADGRMRVVGGTAALVAALHGRLVRSRVSLGTRLVALRPGETTDGGAGGADAAEVGDSSGGGTAAGGITAGRNASGGSGAAGATDGLSLTLEVAGQLQQVHAAAVISTLTPRQLATAVAWSPALPPALAARWLAAPTWMAAQAKFMAWYAQPFWRSDGLSGSASSQPFWRSHGPSGSDSSQAGPLAEVYDAGDAHGGVAALFGFAGLPHQARAQLGEAELKERCLAQLVRLFGPQAATPERVWLQDWATEVFTATRADLDAPPEHPDVLAHDLPAPWQGRLHLAGSEFASEDPGYLEGAVQAAERAVKGVLGSRATGQCKVA